MKSFIKFAAIAGFLAASVGIVACNNNTRSLRATAPGAADDANGQGGGPMKEIDTPIESTATDKVDVEFGIIDPDNRGNTFTVSGELSADGQDADHLKSIDGKDVLVVRVQTPSGLMDFGFYYQGLRSDGIPSIYMSHQDQRFFLYKLPNALPNDFNQMAEYYGLTKDELLVNLAQFLGSAQPKFVTPGSDNPNGNTLPVNIIQQWVDKMESDLVNSI